MGQKILVIGKGTIGTIYAYKLTKHGINIKHLIRTKPYSNVVNLDLLDISKTGRQKINDEYEYNYITTEERINFNEFDYIIVPVRHYQIKDVFNLIHSIKTETLKKPILIFGNVWDELKEIERLHDNPNLVLFGMPRGGGSITNNLLKGSILREVILESNELKENYLKEIENIFSQINRDTVKIHKIQDWYWTHLATTLAWIAGSVKARGFLQYSKSYKLIKESIEAGKEALNIVKARGADIEVCEDINPFRLPSFMSALIVMIMLKRDDVTRISQGHGENYKEELYKIYSDILNTGKSLGINTPLLQSYSIYFEEMLQFSK